MGLGTEAPAQPEDNLPPNPLGLPRQHGSAVSPTVTTSPHPMFHAMSPAELANHLDHIEGQCHAIEEHMSRLSAHLAALRHGAESPPAFRNVIHNLPPGKMDRVIFIDVISCQIDAYTENRGKYNIKDFRKHCEPLLAKCFHQEDLEPSDSGAPKWIDRFGYAHSKIAERRGYIHQSNGTYVKLSS